jgi:hypothetical protein
LQIIGVYCVAAYVNEMPYLQTYYVLVKVVSFHFTITVSSFTVPEIQSVPTLYPINRMLSPVHGILLGLLDL